MEIIRCHRTAGFSAVFRLHDHLDRFEGLVDRDALAIDILEALEAAGLEEAFVCLDDRGRFHIASEPPPSEPAALFLGHKGRFYAVKGEPSVIRDTLVTLMGAMECDRAFESDESFFADPVRGVVPIRDGPMTRQARELYRMAVRGELRGYESWLTYVGRILV